MSNIAEKTTGAGLNPATELYKKNLDNAIYSCGNNFRVKKLIKKLEAGKKVYIAAIGGSVTEGAGPRNPDGGEKWTSGYAFQFVDKLKAKYPQAEIIFDGTGLSGSSSALGVIRYEKDITQVLGASPDILIMEYAVNDSGECTNTRGFERIIRNVLEAKKDSLVIPVYAHATYENTQIFHIPVADFYQLPQISIKNALINPECGVDLVQGGEFFSDYVHPTLEGHTYMADCLMNLLEKAAAGKKNEEFPVPETYFNKNPFVEFHTVYANTRDANVKIEKGSFTGTDNNTQLIKKGGTEFPLNWHHSSGNESLKVTLNCKALIMAYKHQGNWLAQEFGKADVFVDGKQVKNWDGNTYSPEGKKTGWNDCVTELLIDADECGEHTVEIKMAQGEESKGFTVLAMGYSK